MPRQVNRPVVFTGENPGLSLFRSGTDDQVASVSYWRSTYSAHGEGNTLVFWLDLAAAGIGAGMLTAIYTDNAPLARFVTDTFTQHFGGFQDKGFSSIAPEHARFFQESDSRRYHRVVAQSERHQIELGWRDVRDYQQVIGTDLPYGGHRFALATVICPCAEATITIDGKQVSGEVRLSERDGRLQSSAFLAFAESWVDNGPVTS